MWWTWGICHFMSSVLRVCYQMSSTWGSPKNIFYWPDPKVSYLNLSRTFSRVFNQFIPSAHVTLIFFTHSSYIFICLSKVSHPVLTSSLIFYYPSFPSLYLRFSSVLTFPQTSNFHSWTRTHAFQHVEVSCLPKSLHLLSISFLIHPLDVSIYLMIIPHQFLTHQQVSKNHSWSSSHTSPCIYVAFLTQSSHLTL